jgi:hypothetical protein
VADDDHAIGWKVLPKGTPVVSADGVEVGTVVKAQEDEKAHIFDGLVVRTEGGRRFVDAPEVERITASRVTLTISAAEVAELPEHRGLRGRVERAAQRRARRIRRRFGG